jgi:hypothetical protein
MRKLIVGSVVALLALTGAGHVAAQTGISQATLNEQNASGETGVAMIGSVDDTHTRIEITLDGAPKTAQPAHLHLGSCASLDPKPAYPLNDVVGGHSVTVLAVPISDLLGGKYALNVHKSASEISTYVACGDLTAFMNNGGLAPGAGGAPGMPSTGAGNELPLIGVGLVSGLALLVLGRRARRAQA